MESDASDGQRSGHYFTYILAGKALKGCPAGLRPALSETHSLLLSKDHDDAYQYA
jgi:hypothetical protein